jgi:hypothetical protein
LDQRVWVIRTLGSIGVSIGSMRKISATTAAINRPPAALFLPRSTIPHRGESKANTQLRDLVSSSLFRYREKSEK